MTNWFNFFYNNFLVTSFFGFSLTTYNFKFIQNNHGSINIELFEQL